MSVVGTLQTLMPTRSMSALKGKEDVCDPRSRTISLLTRTALASALPVQRAIVPCATSQLSFDLVGRRYWIRTSDPCDVNQCSKARRLRLLEERFYFSADWGFTSVRWLHQVLHFGLAF
jgi:hypothetical protein